MKNNDGTHRKTDRADQMIRNPGKYFDDARQRREREVREEMRSRKSGFRTA